MIRAVARFHSILQGTGVSMGEGLLQPMHLLVILAIAVFVFGPKKIPELGKGLGEGIRGFREALKGGMTEEPEIPASSKQIESTSSSQK